MPKEAFNICQISDARYNIPTILPRYLKFHSPKLTSLIKAKFEFYWKREQPMRDHYYVDTVVEYSSMIRHISIFNILFPNWVLFLDGSLCYD